MHYRDYPASKVARSSRVVFGSFIALAALGYGIFIAVPQLQRAFAMQHESETMSWAQLVQNGLSDNAHVTLIGIDLPPEDDQARKIREMIGELDPKGDPAEMKSRLTQSLQEIDPQQLLSFTATPLKLIPRGIDPARVPSVVVMSRLDLGVKHALPEIQTKGTVTGYVRNSVRLDWIIKGFEFAKVQPPQNLLDRRARYVVSPTISVPDQATSQGILAATILIAAVGLVIAGSGGPSIIGSLFMPIPSLISLLGFPLRYGRGRFLTRMLYMLIGLCGMVGGGLLAWYPGGLTQVGGDALLQNLGFCLVVLGLAAFLGARLNGRVRRLERPVQKPKTYQEPDTGFQIQKTVVLDLETPVPADQYADPRLSDASEVELTAAMNSQVHSLEAQGFDAAKQVFIHDDDQRILTTLSLGCHEIVLCEMTQQGKSVLVRLVSVLSDGLVLITMSSNTPRVSPLRVGLNGVYARGKSDSAIDLLPEHLDRTAGIAEERSAQVVPIDAYEKLDVFLLARRVLVDIQNEYNEAKRTVLKANYGRFAFPGRRVEVLAKG